MAEERKPMKLYTDIDMRGNEIHHAYVGTPETDNSPTPRSYVDKQSVFDTEWAEKFKKPLVSVGGLTTETEVADTKIKGILDQLLFPVIPPVYKESEIFVRNTPIRVLGGVPGEHRIIADIIPNDRTNALSNITCRTIDAFNKVTNVTAQRFNSLKNIACAFSSIAIGPDYSSKLYLSVVMSNGIPKINNHGVTCPNVLFQSARTLLHEVEYRVSMPVFYWVGDINDTLPLNIHGFCSWQGLLDNLEYFELDKYIDGEGCTDIEFEIGNDSAKNVILFVPAECLGFFINDENLLDCCDIAEHTLVIPNTRNGYNADYVAIQFKTGDYKYSSPKTARVRFKSLGTAWRDDPNIPNS